MRRNNFADMSICEQLTVLGEHICDDLCKFRDKAEERVIQADELEDLCSTCIVKRLYYSGGKPWKSDT